MSAALHRLMSSDFPASFSDLNKNLSLCAKPKWASMLLSQPEHDHGQFNHRTGDIHRRNDLRQQAPPVQQPKRAQILAKLVHLPPPVVLLPQSLVVHLSLVSENLYQRILTYTTSLRFVLPPTISSLIAYLLPPLRLRGVAICEAKRL